jgi:hypothetical protein
MATMQYSYSDLYNRVSKFLGTYGSSGPTGTDLTDAKDFVKAGYLQFLTSYDWTFRRRYTTLSFESGTYVYELPGDYGGIRTRPQFTDQTGYPPLEERADNEIEELRTYGENAGYPEYYTIVAGPYAPETGMKYEFKVWPTPNQSWTVYYSYYTLPSMMSNDTDVPLGSADVSECLRAFCLAAAEEESDEAGGLQRQVADRELGKAIALDKKREPREQGYMGDWGRVSPWEVARGSTRINPVTYNV